MAAGRKEYELMMKLTAALSSSFNSTFQTAMSTTKKLQDSLQNIQKVQKNIDGYKRTQDAIASTKNSVKELGTRHNDLQQKLAATIAKEKELQKALEKSKKATGTETEEYIRLESALKKTQTEKEKLTGQIKTNETATQKATRQIEEEENKLADLTKELKAAGVNTEKLTKENDQLQKTYDKVKKSQEDIARLNQRIGENKEAISATKKELAKTVGAATALGAALYVPVKGAIEFESSMAEVAKVVDWIGNGNNATAEQIQQYNKLSGGLYELTRQIPMTAKEFAEITAAAGQANVAMDNAGLLEFTEDAAKMGIAFDIAADQAGDFMAKWRTSFKMTQDEVVELSDVINYLGNTTPATAAQISNVVTRIGPLGEVAGLASKDIAALSASIVGVGIDENVAATGIKNLMLDLTKGTATTKKMNGVLDKLGTSATDLAERMQTDATGAIMDFMRAIKELPAAEQAAALNTYFGEQSVGAIAPLLSNLEFLEEQFYKVGDAGQYAGSMEAEYAARAATSENTVQLMKNAVKELSDTFGSIFVPSAKDGAQALTEIIYKVTDFVRENGETIKTVTTVAGVILTAKTAFLVLKTALLTVKGAILGVKLAIAGYQAAQLIATAGAGTWAIVSGAAAAPTAAFAGAMLAAAGPVLIIVGAIALAIGAIVLLIKHWEKVIELAKKVGNAIAKVFGGGGETELTTKDVQSSGKSTNTRKTRKFANGTNFTPDTFIAGDVNGKGGELITGARGRKVFTAAETNAIFDNINKAKAINTAIPRVVSNSDTFKPIAQPIPTTNTRSGGEATFVYSPTINTGGNEPQNIEEIKQLLKEHGEEMLKQFKDFLRHQQDDERRMRYA